MGWLTIALCFSALAASQGKGTPEPPTLVPFDGKGTPEPPTLEPFDESNTTEPTMFTVNDEDETTYSMMFTLNYGDKVEDANEEDVVEDDEDQMEPLLLSQRRNFLDTNPDEVDGQPLFQGDILLTPRQWREITERKGLADTRYRWPEVNGSPLVPYRFTDSRLNTNVIRQGIRHWEANTCIRFHQTTNTNQPHLRFIYGNGCNAQYGRIFYRNGQDVSIGQYCDTVGIVAHEIGHAIGFFHEHSRPDRDSYVVINKDNIEDNMERWYDKISSNLIDSKNIPYDYSSVMHYDPLGYSVNGKSTIITRHPFAQPIIGQLRQLSHRDIHLANIMYRCTDKWLAACGRRSDPCRNGGYLGSSCRCVCPPGTSGTNCETRTGGYYDSLVNSCTKKITRATTLTSPNYPNNYPATKCVQWIEAPACHVPQLYFYYFQMYRRTSHCAGGRYCCYFDALEIREGNSIHSNVYCATDIRRGTTITGTTRHLILFFRTITNYYTGFAAQLTFKKVC